MQSLELLWMLVGFVLTLLVFSYVFGDNPLFRLATYLFVGVSAGYVAVLVSYQVILPRLVRPLLAGSLNERLLAFIPLVLAGLLVFKLSNRLAFLGNVSMALLVGVGTAIMLAGVFSGTLLRQSAAAVAAFDSRAGLGGLVEAALLLLATITTLAFFHFGGPARSGQAGSRPAVIEALGRIGQVFIGITLGALFAGVYSAALTALIERIGFLADTLTLIPTLF